MTVWLHVELFPQRSVARQVRVAENACPQAPLVTVLTITIVTLVVSKLSEAVGLSNIQLDPHTTILFVGQLITGGVVSETATIWLQVAAFEQPSVALQVRVAMNAFPQVKLVTVLTILMVTFVPPHKSLAVGASNVQAVPASITLFVPQIIVGAVVSTTATTWVKTK
jgi:hypothetical protein